MESTNKNFSIIESSQEFNEPLGLDATSKARPQIIEFSPQDNYEEKLLQIARVTKVVKGGKRMSFRVVLIVGDGRQKVGLGVGHGKDVGTATRKAVANAIKTLINIPLTAKKSIPHTISLSYGAARILLKPAAEGAGIVAGGPMRSVLELSGLKNIVAKQQGSNNILNNAKATILALNMLNEKVKQGTAQNSHRSYFYQQIMSKSMKPVLFI